MSYVKNIAKILLLAQCLLLFCVCDKKEEVIVTTEQNRLNLADFVKCPFNEEFNDKTNLEKYVLKKFGKPDSVERGEIAIDEVNGVEGDRIRLTYDGKYSFEIYKWTFKKKKFEIFRLIYIKDCTDLKYGINNETTIKDIERLFGNPGSIEKREGDVAAYYYSYGTNQYLYNLAIGLGEGKLYSLRIHININPLVPSWGTTP